MHILFASPTLSSTHHPSTAQLSIEILEAGVQLRSSREGASSYSQNDSFNTTVSTLRLLLKTGADEGI